jgi:hypothetical protein
LKPILTAAGILVLASIVASDSHQTRYAHLQTEIDKGQDADDPAKMIRYWIRIVDGSITQPELTVLQKLASRKSTRRSARPDSELYMSMFANLLISSHEERKTRYAKDEERRRLEERSRQELQRQIDELKHQIESLKTNGGGKNKTAQ